MKRNVDLTENRDFSRPSLSNRELRNIINQPNIGYPWSAKQSLVQYDTESNELQDMVFTGNKRDRSRKKEWKLYIDLTSCECCGKDYSNSPWKMAGTLCVKCDQELDNDINNQKDLVIGNLNRRKRR
ncbi:hypothetical protein [Bacillus smithii]|uniref:hypothetical protein n=1 Tax=Bacillus smithii TaxID=1479 RepID=UPI003D192594